jgi:hypothetical protein
MSGGFLKFAVNEPFALHDELDLLMSPQALPGFLRLSKWPHFLMGRS